MKIKNQIFEKALDYLYEKAVQGLPGLDSAEALAADFNEPGKPIDKNARSLVRWQIAKAGTVVFVTGLGGVLTMPITIPANVAGSLLIQIRMIAAIAHMAGYDLRSDQVKSLVYMCMCGSAAADVAKDVGIQIGTKITLNMVKKIPGAVLIKINQAVGFRLFTKFGQTGVVNLGKCIPIAGGVVSGCFDSITTKTIGKITIKIFIGKDGGEDIVGRSVD